ncbi:putative stress-induced protein [Escherichia coli 2845650]|nr:putative stress-induced protein [Escherichia coli 2845650]
MKTAKEYSDTAKREVSVDVDALLAAINEMFIAARTILNTLASMDVNIIHGVNWRMPSNWIFMTSASLK